jgi:hypothetical protein
MWLASSRQKAVLARQPSLVSLEIRKTTCMACVYSSVLTPPLPAACKTLTVNASGERARPLYQAYSLIATSRKLTSVSCRVWLPLHVAQFHKWRVGCVNEPLPLQIQCLFSNCLHHYTRIVVGPSCIVYETDVTYLCLNLSAQTG